MKRSLIATLAAGGSLAVAGLVGGLAVDAAAPAYPLPPTTSVAQQPPPPAPPTNITLPRTGGGDGVENTVMMGGTLAVAGLGLVLVTRRRRQQPSAG